MDAFNSSPLHVEDNGSEHSKSCTLPLTPTSTHKSKSSNSSPTVACESIQGEIEPITIRSSPIPAPNFVEAQSSQQPIEILSDSESDDNDLFAGRKASRQQTVASQSTETVNAAKQPKTEPMHSTLAIEKSLDKSYARKSINKSFDDMGPPAVEARRRKNPADERAAKGGFAPKPPAPKKSTGISTVKIDKLKVGQNMPAPERPQTIFGTFEQSAMLAAQNVPTAKQRIAKKKEADKALEKKRENLQKRYTVDLKNIADDVEREKQVTAKVNFTMQRHEEMAQFTAQEKARKKAAAAAAAKRGIKRAAEDDVSDDGSETEDDKAGRPAAKKAKTAKAAKKTAEDTRTTYTVRDDQTRLDLAGEQEVVRYAVYSTPFMNDMSEYDDVVVREGEALLRRDMAKQHVKKLVLKVMGDEIDDVETENFGQKSNGALEGTIIKREDGTFCIISLRQETVHFNEINPVKYARKKLSKEFMAQYQPRFEVYSHRYMIPTVALTKEDFDEDDQWKTLVNISEKIEIKSKLEGSYTTLQPANERAADVLEAYNLPCTDPDHEDAVYEASDQLRNEAVDFNGSEGICPHYAGRDYFYLKIEVQENQLKGPIALGEGLEQE